MKKFIFALAFALASVLVYSQESKWIDSTEFKELSYKVPKLMQWRISDDNKEFWIIDSTYKFFKFDISTGAILDTFRFNKDGKKIRICSDFLTYYIANFETPFTTFLKIYDIADDKVILNDSIMYSYDTYQKRLSKFEGKFDYNSKSNIISGIIRFSVTEDGQSGTIYYYSQGRFVLASIIKNKLKLSRFDGTNVPFDYTFFNNENSILLTGYDDASSTGKFGGGTFHYKYIYEMNDNYKITFNNYFNKESSIEAFVNPKVSYDNKNYVVYSLSGLLFSGKISSKDTNVIDIKDYIKQNYYFNLHDSYKDNLFLLHLFKPNVNSKLLFLRYSLPKAIDSLEIKNYFPNNSLSLKDTNIRIIFSDMNGVIRIYQYNDIKKSVTKIVKPNRLVYRLNETVELSGTTTANSPEIIWDFGDGITAPYNLSVSHVFNKTGTYLVKLSTKNINGISFDTISIKIINDLFVNLKATYLNDSVPRKVQFDNLSNGDILNVKWDFGNGDTSNLQNPVYEFNKVGDYDISLYCWDEVGNKFLTKTKYIAVGKNQSFSFGKNTGFFSESNSDQYPILDIFMNGAVEIENDKLFLINGLNIFQVGNVYLKRIYNVLLNSFESRDGWGSDKLYKEYSDLDNFYGISELYNQFRLRRYYNKGTNVTQRVDTKEFIISPNYTIFDNINRPILLSYLNNDLLISRVNDINLMDLIRSETIKVFKPKAFVFLNNVNKILLIGIDQNYRLKAKYFDNSTLEFIENINFNIDSNFTINGAINCFDNLYLLGKYNITKTESFGAIMTLDLDCSFKLLEIDSNYKEIKIWNKIDYNKFVYTGPESNNCFTLFNENQKFVFYLDPVINGNIQFVSPGISNSVLYGGKINRNTAFIGKVDLNNLDAPGYNYSTVQNNLISPLQLNFPNPFNQSTQFEFNADLSGQYNMKIIDYLGVELFNETGIANEGKNTINFNRKGLPPGAYFCKIVCGNQNFNYKFMISE